MEFNNWYEVFELILAVAFFLAFFLPYDFKNKTPVRNKIILLAFLSCIWSFIDFVINYFFKFRELLLNEFFWLIPTVFYIFIYLKKRELALPFLKIYCPLVTVYALVYGWIKVSWAASIVIFLIFVPFNVYLFRYARRLERPISEAHAHE